MGDLSIYLKKNLTAAIAEDAEKEIEIFWAIFLYSAVQKKRGKYDFKKDCYNFNPCFYRLGDLWGDYGHWDAIIFNENNPHHPCYRRTACFFHSLFDLF